MAEFGSLDPNDWREQEAQAGLALQQKEAEAAKQRSWADTGRGILSAPYRLAKGFASAPPQAPVAPGELPEADALLKQDPIANVLSNVGGAIKSGFTAPGEAASGEIPQYTDGHTSPEMVHRAFDTAAMAGGASFGGKAAAAPVVAADSAKAALPVAAAEHAPPFYSTLEHAVAKHPQEVAPAKQWLGTLSNKPGVKPEELKYTGITDMLAAKGDQPVTKGELQDHLEQNKVQLSEVTKAKGEMPAWKDLTGDQQYAVQDRFNDLHDYNTHGGPDLEDWYNEIADHSRNGHETALDGIISPAKFSEYQLPGGENYREKLLTLPRKEPKIEHSNVASGDAGVDRLVNNLDIDRNNYRSSHWDEPNVLAHLRMNDRDVTGAAGEAKPSLHLEEIQSDWHQQGRQKGYKTGDPEALLNERNALASEQAKIDDWNSPEFKAYGPKIDALDNQIRSARSGVPDAPFKKNWHELALKRALHDAAEGGYDRLSWTPGEAQAARYDLSKTFNRIKATPVLDQNGLKYEIKGYSGNGGGDYASMMHVVPEEKLPDVVGKEMAQKIVDQTGGKKPAEFTGLDLKVGGEGMKGFYDKIVPDYLNKVGKPHGTQVKQGSLGTEVRMYDNEGKPGASFPNMYAAQQWLKRNPQAAEYWTPRRRPGQDVHYMDIPPSLKQQLLSKGMPLFEDNAAAAPIAAAAHAGEANAQALSANAGRGAGPAGGRSSLEEAQRASARADVNDAIERTHRLTGMPRNEVVKRGLVKKEIPLYAGGVPMGSLHPQDDQ